MNKTYMIDGIEYTCEAVSAIAICDGEDESKRQPAILVSNTLDSGELVQMVVFGWEMPNSDEEFRDMVDDSSAWEHASEEHHGSVTRYDLTRDRVEIRVRYIHGHLESWSSQDIWDEYERKMAQDTQLKESFASLDEAKKAFEKEKHSTSTYLMQGQIGKLLEAEILMLEKNIYNIDADGEEWLDQGSVVDWYAEPYIVEDDDDEEEEE